MHTGTFDSPRSLFSCHIPCVYSLACLLILSVLMFQQGCTATPWKPHGTEDVRVKINTIELAVAEELPRVTVELPSKGAASGAGRKAGKWSRDWAMTAAGIVGQGREVGLTTSTAMLVVTPVVASAGAVYGEIEAPSAAVVESQEAQVRGVLQAEDLIRRLQRFVLTQVTDRTDILIAPLPKESSDQIGHRETLPASEMPQPDAMLKILLKSIDLRGTFDVDPPLALHLNTEVTLTAPSATPPLYTHVFQYVTGARRLTEWTADDAKGFREAVDLSLALLVELIVDDLFLVHPFVHEHRRALRHGQ
jgi:hypothetical protein